MLDVIFKVEIRVNIVGVVGGSNTGNGAVEWDGGVVDEGFEFSENTQKIMLIVFNEMRNDGLVF